MEDRLGILLIESDSETASTIRLAFAEIKESLLHVVSSCREALEYLPDSYPDLILIAHDAETSESEQLELFQRYPSAYILCSLPFQDDDLVDRYIKAGANRILIKNDDYIADLIHAVKKALILIMERKSFLLASQSDSSTNEEESLSDVLAGALQPDETILHYKILEEIGEGGMGEIYRAEDLKLGRQVAIKVLPPKIARNRKMRQRLAFEARAASALNHSNIVTIHAIEEARNLSFIVMEYVQGKSLQKLFSEGPVDFIRLLKFGKQIAEALNAAHRIGVVHRDIKPGNIMITTNDDIKLLDFGLAKRVSGPHDQALSDLKRSDLTGVGTVLGTVTYMSPEQTRGEAIDERSDIFSFGCVLYEGATGKLPFNGLSVLSVMDAIAKAEYLTPSSVNRELPAGFDSVIARTLAKDRNDRYASASELAADLAALMDEMIAVQPGPQSKETSASSSVGNSEVQAARFSLLSKPVVWILIAAFITVALGLTFWLIDRRPQMNVTTTALAPRISSVAVLPLLNLSGNPEEDYFADGLTESLIADLAKINNLKVISRTSVMHYKNSNKALPKIAEELKVDAIVEGSVLRAGNKVRITAQLIHATSDTHVWADNYERAMGDILSLQSEVSQAIANEIQARTLNSRKEPFKKNLSVNPEAYEAYLKGRYHWNKRTKEGLEKAVQYFREAIALQPNYAAAYSALADTWQVMGSMKFLPPEHYLPLTREAAEKAVELDGTLAEAHTSLAANAAHDWRWLEAGAEYQKAIQLNPNYATAHQWYSMLLLSLNRCEESIAEIQKAQNLDPISFVINMGVGHTLSHCGRNEEALAQFEKTKEIDPNHWALLGAIALAYQRMGRFEDAILAYEQAWLNDERLRKDAGKRKNALLTAFRSKGEMGYWEMLLKSEQQNPIISRTAVATYYALLGKTDLAFASLEEAYQKHDSALFTLQFWPEYENLRSDPRYSDLVRRMGFPAN